MDALFLKHFSGIEDPRIERCKKHPLLDILFLSISAVVAGAEGWEDIEEFGHIKLDWLRNYVPLAHGIPKHDTVARVLSRLAPEAMQACFIDWMQACVTAVGGEVVAIDGKTLRRSFDTVTRKNPLHMVSAWAAGHGVTLGQVKTAEKSNEITAIPALLALLELKGAIVTIDAMGCQKDIAARIVDKRADYVLAVKGNQPSLHAALVECFETARAHAFKGVRHDYFEQVDSGHGRVEVRRYWHSDELGTIPLPAEWAGLKSIGLAECERHRDGKVSIERRYYISTLRPDARAFGQAVRAHWGIENSCHWVLDLTFREDESRLRRGHAAENFGVLRRIAQNLIKQNAQAGMSRKKMRKCSGWGDAFREKILFGNNL